MQKFRYSIRFRVTSILVILAVSMIVAIVLLNSTMLEKYYMHDKRTVFIQTYENVNASAANHMQGMLDDSAYEQQLEQLSSQTNISIIVIRPDWTIAFASMRNLDDFVRRLQNSLFTGSKEDRGLSEQNYEVIAENDDYTIRQVYNVSVDDTFLELNGTLQDGNMIYMSIAIKSIQDNVRISNRFIWLVGFGVVLISFLLALVLGRYLTRPLQDLTKVAQRMTELDFNARYEKMDKSEIGILGNSMNELSAKLESTISDLKEANIELKRDIESKEEAEERRKEFLSNVSHELKTPIALIQGYAEGLKEAVNDDAESREFYCDVIMDEARKMNDMVKNILNLSHIESGSDQIEIERFDITQLLEGVIQAKRLLASQKGCEIIYEKTEPQQVWADEGRIEEVVTNYLTNAINHCAYEKKIIVKNFRDGDDIKVTVFNTGDPIPEEELDKIWIKFYKVDKARTREYGGNGIGLSIVKAIMDNHKKECGVENQPDGVMFWFTLDAKA